jgi:predicted CopG family antitoxin
MSTHMSSTNISIRDDAYKFLKSLKKKDESFSDVILRFKEEKGNKDRVMRLFGGPDKESIDWKKKERDMEGFRESFEMRVRETSEDMEKARKKK